MVLLLLPLLSLYWVLFANPPKLSNGRFLQTPKSVKSAVFSPFFHLRGTKKHRKYQCFWLRTNAKPRYLRGFEPLRAKITVFTVFCGPSLAKTLLFTQLPACWQKAFFGCQRHKNIVNYTIFTRGQYQKNRKNDQKSTKKRPTRTSKTHLQILPSFFPPPNPQKRENPSRLKDFRGGSAAGARPRVAKAMLSFPHYTARHRRIKGLRPLPPTPVVLGVFCIMLDNFHKDRI